VVGLVLVVVRKQGLQVGVVAESRKRRPVRHACEGLDVINVHIGKRHFFGVNGVPGIHLGEEEGPRLLAGATYDLLRARALGAARERQTTTRRAAYACPQIALRAACHTDVASSLMRTYAAPGTRLTQTAQALVGADGTPSVNLASRQATHAHTSFFS